MFEREIKFIYDFNLNKVNKLGPYFSFEQLTAVELHPAILNYISAEIDYIIFEDRQKLLKNSVFDYSGEKIAHYFSLINEEVKRSKRLSFEYISKLILHASSFTINYLVRPKWTLKKFVFDEGEHRTSNEIKQILNYVYYYNYLKNILISYINSKKILSMNLQEFSELLDKIDKVGVETNLNSILSTALKSMAEFFNIGELQKNKIPLLAIELFLEEKNLEQHLRRLRIVFGDDKTLKCNIKDLQKEFNFVMKEEHEQIPEEETQEQIETIEEPIEAIEESNEEEYQEEIYKDEDVNQTDADENVKSKTEELEMEEEKEFSEEIESTDETETQSIESKNEDEIPITYKPKKLRIRVDKNNEIEPIEDESESEDTEKDSTNVDFSSEEATISTKVFNDRTQDEEDLEIENDLVESELENPEDDRQTEDNQKEFSSEQIEKFDESEDEHYERETEDEQIEEENSMLKSILKEKDEIEEEKFSEDTEEKIFKSIDIAELLENKEMTKIIEIIFDYDIEDFSTVLDKISVCKTIQQAYRVIDEALSNRNFDLKSKEAELFKSIISEYFKSSQ